MALSSGGGAAVTSTRGPAGSGGNGMSGRSATTAGGGNSIRGSPTGGIGPTSFGSPTGTGALGAGVLSTAAAGRITGRASGGSAV